MADAGSFNADLGINMQFNIDSAGLTEVTKTIKEISKGKDLQRYWKDIETATNNASKAMDRYSRNVNSKGLAENFIKQINALKALTKNENLSELFPNSELNIDGLLESAKKIVPKINTEFSAANFSQAFNTFDLLKDKALDLKEVFSMLSNYAELASRNSELSKENSQFRELIGDSDVLEVKSKLSEIKKLRDEAENIFESFLKVNNIERTDDWGDERFSNYFDAIREGSLTATEAISRFKTEYTYLLEEGFKSNNDTFGLEQLQAFSNKLDSIFRQVEETSNKINDIISNGVLTKSVENLSVDSSLTDSQRSLFGNLLKDEESLKSITALFQKLIEESNKTKNNELFNSEQLQQVLSVFDRIENSLSSLRGIISDVGDGEEFSPLLKMINNVQTSISELSTSVKGIGLNMNIDIGSDSELEAKAQSKISNALQAYQRLFDHIKMSGAGGSVINQKFFDFDINQYDTMMGKLQAYKKFIDNMRKEAKAQFNGQDVLYQDTNRSYWTQASSAMGQVTKAFNKMKSSADTNPLTDMFGKTDLSEVLSQLGLIVAKLEEISSTASSFKEIFTNGFNVTASVEEIDKLTNRVKELEDELSKIKLNPVGVDKSNISSADDVAASFDKTEEKIDSVNEKLQESKKYVNELRQAFMNIVGKASNRDSLLEQYPELSEFKNKTSVDKARSFLNTDEWKDFLATLPNAHAYLESIGYDFERIYKLTDEEIKWFKGLSADELLSRGWNIGGTPDKADYKEIRAAYQTQIKDVFQGGSSSAEKLEQDIKNIESATDRATKSAKEYRKILSQVGEFDIDSKVSAMYKRNDGQLESWTWRAKTDDEGNVLYNQDGQIDYGEPTVAVISKYEQLEKIIVKADNELRNLQKDLAETKAYDATASTTNIEAKISDQKEYIRLLEQTVKVISQSDEYLLDEQQIIDARNKAAREYALTIGSKQEKTDAKQSASDEKKRLANIEQVNRALNKQQIAIDVIEKTYNKSTNPDLDREVSNRQDLAELAQKKLDIQTKINSLQGQERNSANEKEFLELEKLIAEYKELAKYKLKANNPSKQELGGQNLQTLIQEQIYKYDKLITKAEKYGDATTDTVEKLKNQRDILSKISADGKYTATADQYYTSRDTYKVESAALSAFEAETKAAEQEAKALEKVDKEQQKIANNTKLEEQKRIYKELNDSLDRYATVSKRIASGNALGSDEEEAAKLQVRIEELQNSPILSKEQLELSQSKLEKIETTLEDIQKITKETTLDSLQSEIDMFNKDYDNRNIKPTKEDRSGEYSQALNEYKNSIEALIVEKERLSKLDNISEEELSHYKKLKETVQENANALKAMSAAQKGSDEASRTKEIDKLTKYLEKNTRISKEAREQLEGYLALLKSGDPSVNVKEIHTAWTKVAVAEREAGREGKSFLDIFKNKVVYNYAAQLAGYFLSFMDIIRYAREGIDTLKEFDDGLTKISYTMDMTKSQLNDLGESILDMASDMKTSLDDAMSVAQIYANMNTTAEEIQKLSEPTLILSNLTGFDASTVADDIQAVTQQFDILAEDSMHIADVYDYISRNISVDYSKGIESIAEAVQVAGSTAKQAGLEYEQLAAIVGKTAEKTRLEGSQIGNGLKTIMTRLSKVGELSDEVDNETMSDASESLHKIGVEVYNADGSFRQFDVIMGELANKWSDLTDAEKSNISFAIAATRQTNLLSAVLSNFSDSMQLAEGATNANGSALENQQKYMDSFAGHLQSLETEAKIAWINILDSETLKGGVDLLTGIVKVVGQLVDKFGLLGTAGLVGGGILSKNGIG